MSDNALSGLDALLDDAHRHLGVGRRRRARLVFVAPVVVTVGWVTWIVAADHWGRVTDNWAAAATMVFGSFVAGSTPQGGGAVAFPVFTKVLEVPSEVARSFSLVIQAVGMGSAAVGIVLTRRLVEWRVVALAAPAAVAAFVATVVGAGDLDQLFWPSVLSAPYVKVTFTVVLAAMAWLVFVSQRVPIRRVETRLRGSGLRLPAAIVAAGVLGGVASALVGSGADVCVFVVVVLLLGLDSRVGVPTSVVVMAVVSVTGIVLLGLIGGQLDVALGAGGSEVVAVGGRTATVSNSVTLPLPADRFDLFGMWLAAAPVVAWGAPVGSWAASRMSRRALVRFVLALALLEVVSTAIFLDALRDDPALVAYAVVGIVGSCAGLSLVARRRHDVFGVSPLDREATLRRQDLDVDADYRDRLGPGGHR